MKQIHELLRLLGLQTQSSSEARFCSSLREQVSALSQDNTNLGTLVSAKEMEISAKTAEISAKDALLQSKERIINSLRTEEVQTFRSRQASVIIDYRYTCSIIYGVIKVIYIY